MPTAVPVSALPKHIQRLLDERQRHSDAIAGIDRMLEEIRGLLGTPRALRSTGRRASPTPPAALAPIGLPQVKRRRRGSYAMTAEQSILAFVKAKGQPRTHDIRSHWRTEHRKGTADNVLSRLVKAKRLKRIPLENERGSRYALPS